MIRFKKIDVIIQICLITAAILINLIRQSDILSELFLSGYLIVGGWQLISAIIHFIRPIPVKLTVRRIYLILLGFTVLIGLITAVTSDAILMFFLGLLFFSPLLAILYLVTCIKENEKMKLLSTN